MKVLILQSNEETAAVIAHLVGQEIEVMTEKEMGVWAGANEDRNGLLACIDWDTYSYVMPISDSDCYSFKKEWVQPLDNHLFVRVGVSVKISPQDIDDMDAVLSSILNGNITHETYAPAGMFGEENEWIGDCDIDFSFDEINIKQAALEHTSTEMLIAELNKRGFKAIENNNPGSGETYLVTIDHVDGPCTQLCDTEANAKAFILGHVLSYETFEEFDTALKGGIDAVDGIIDYSIVKQKAKDYISEGKIPEEDDEVSDIANTGALKNPKQDEITTVVLIKDGFFNEAKSFVSRKDAEAFFKQEILEQEPSISNEDIKACLDNGYWDNKTGFDFYITQNDLFGGANASCEEMALVHEENGTDFILVGERCYVTVNGLTVLVNKGDTAVTVDVYPINQEDGDPVESITFLYPDYDEVA